MFSPFQLYQSGFGFKGLTRLQLVPRLLEHLKHHDNDTTCFNIRRQDEPSGGTALGPARLARGRNGTTGRAYEDQTAAEVVPFGGTGASQTSIKLMRQTHEDLYAKTRAKNKAAKLDRATKFVCDSIIMDLYASFPK